MSPKPADAFEAIRDALELSEAAAVSALAPAPSAAARADALALARALVSGARARADERSYLDAFLQEFGLSNQEGIALMCLAEALLRIPDDATADRLIADKLRGGDWAAHVGRSDSLFVNASTWGLMLTGRLIDLPANWRQDAGGWLKGFTLRLGEPVVRQALRRGMQIIGGEFVVGAGIDAALARCRRESDLALCSFDMLGEGARSDRQARGYLAAYESAIDAVARANRDLGAGTTYSRHGVSIKLSALDPRYALSHRDGALRRLLPRVHGTRAPGRAPRPAGHDRCRGSRSTGAVAGAVRGARPRPGHARLAGPGARGAGLRQARATRDRLGGRARA